MGIWLVFFTFFKLYKWYQIAQHTTNAKVSFNLKTQCHAFYFCALNKIVIYILWHIYAHEDNISSITKARIAYSYLLIFPYLYTYSSVLCNKLIENFIIIIIIIIIQNKFCLYNTWDISIYFQGTYYPEYIKFCIFSKKFYHCMKQVFVASNL